MTVYLLVSANISFGTFNHMNNCLLNNITNTVITILNIEDIKRQLLQDKDFLSRIEKSMTEAGDQNKPEAESEDNENLDMDEDMMLAGLSMFDSEI